MKRAITLLLAALLLAALFAGCAGIGLKPITPPSGEAEPTKTEPAKTEAPKTEPFAPSETAAPATDPPATQPPATEPPATKPTAPQPIDTDIAGLWKYTFEFGKLMQAEMLGDTVDDPSLTEEQKEDILAAFGKMFEGVEMIMSMDLKEDGSYEMRMEEDSMQSAAERMRENIPGAVPDLLCAMMGCDADELEEMLTSMGMTMDDMVENMSASLNPEEMMGSMEPVAGEYTYENNELVMTNDDGNTTVMIAELKGDELIVSSIDGESELNELGQLFPMIFVR